MLPIWHLVGPAAAAVIVWLSLVALPHLPPPPAPPPGSVEHSEIPEEYREQVGRYFQPD